MPPLRLFYSYSHRDENYRDELAKHLKLLERTGILISWHDRRISPGEEWRGRIDENLKKAEVILLLISPDFIASDYCYDVELQYAMQRHHKGEARVIPIIIRDVNWKDAPFGIPQALPVDGKAVSASGSIDTALANVEKGIRAVINEITQNAGVRKPFFSEALKGDKTSDSSPHEQQAVLQAQAEVLVDTKSREIELTIDADFDNYTEQDKALLLNAIASLLKIRDSELKIKKIQRGSIKITLEMRSDLATQLYQAVKAGELKHLRVIKAELKGEEALAEGSEYPNDLTEGSIEELHSRTYQVLALMATKILRRARVDDGIACEDLVSETYLRLFRSMQRIPEDLNLFYVKAARTMLLVLKDYNRYLARHTHDGDPLQIEFAAEPLTEEQTEERIALSEALKRLEAVDSRLSRVLELHYLDGLSLAEIAKVLNQSPNQVRRNWVLAKAWLKRELSA